MITGLWRRFLSLHILVKIIWLFCVLGMFSNAILIAQDLSSGGVLLRLHIGFFILYVGQVVFILCKEPWVAILSLLQAVMAFLTSLDFTFVPPLRMIGNMIYGLSGGFSLETMEVYKYVFVSLAFTIELFKTWCLWALVERPQPQAKEHLVQ